MDCLRCETDTSPPVRGDRRTIGRPPALCHACRMELAHEANQLDIDPTPWSECLVCRGPIEAGTRGPIPKTCSPRCRVLLHRVRTDTRLL